MTLKIFLDDKSFHYLKRSIPPGSHSKLVLVDAVHFKNFAAWFGDNTSSAAMKPKLAIYCSMPAIARALSLQSTRRFFLQGCPWKETVKTGSLEIGISSKQERGERSWSF